MWVIGSPNFLSTNMVPTTYVTIDGSNTVGGTTKDLTIQGPVTATQRSVFRIFGDNDNITIKNCVIVNRSSSTSTNAAINTTNFNTASVNYNPDNLTVQNCTLTSTTGTASAGFHVANSGTPTVGMTGLTLRDNAIAGNLRGVFVSYTYDANIFGNSITVAATGATTNITSYGITVQTNFATTGVFNIYNNKLTSLTTNCTTAGASNGIMGIDNQNTTAHTVNIYNNFIGGFGLTGAANNCRIYGIRTTSTSTTNIYHNTINIPELPDMAASNNIAGIAFATAALTEGSPSAAANATIKNNIIVIDESVMKVWGIRRVGATGTFTSDYNNVYINPANVSGYYGFFNATDYSTLGAWQTASSLDANSKSVAVTFAGASDLHLSGGSIGNTDLSGTPIATVTTDIDGETRSVSSPYMGADEHPEALLPVQLVSFTATSRTNSVLLNWRTLSEINNYGFEIQRSADQASGFSSLPNSFIAGNGTTNQPHDYAFTDNSVQAGSWYYRLKQIDLDGSIHYSEPVQVNGVTGIAENTPNAFSLAQNYPNPFNPSTTIRFAIAKSELVSLKVYDMLGREVATLANEQMSAGNYSLSFNATGLASGTYIYRLQAGSFVATKKMSLMK
jgi:hypothetical protein